MSRPWKREKLRLGRNADGLADERARELVPGARLQVGCRRERGWGPGGILLRGRKGESLPHLSFNLQNQLR